MDSKWPMHSDAFSQELHIHFEALSHWLKTRARELGFTDLRITDTDVSDAHPRLLGWLAKGHHGQMAYMEQRAPLRSDPARLQAGALRSICLTMPYWHPDAPSIDGKSQTEPFMPLARCIEREEERLRQADQAVVSIYARGRDYHKVIRGRLQTLADELAHRAKPLMSIIQLNDAQQSPNLEYRVFTDSAPLMEVELARKAGLGWRGKHTLLLNREAGSLFFLGEILINLPLPLDEPVQAHCGSCQACMDICPTQAIVAPYELDARRCISYLTIEHRDVIPVEFRRAMGNRVYGCDDCQLVCPWNKYAQRSTVPDFMERNGLGSASLLELWTWTENQFEARHAGSAIRRIGYERWRRNLAVALGNALASTIGSPIKEVIEEQLRDALPCSSPLVAEHIEWALAQTADH